MSVQGLPVRSGSSLERLPPLEGREQVKARRALDSAEDATGRRGDFRHLEDGMGEDLKDAAAPGMASLGENSSCCRRIRLEPIAVGGECDGAVGAAKPVENGSEAALASSPSGAEAEHDDTDDDDDDDPGVFSLAQLKQQGRRRRRRQQGLL